MPIENVLKISRKISSQNQIEAKLGKLLYSFAPREKWNKKVSQIFLNFINKNSNYLEKINDLVAEIEALFNLNQLGVVNSLELIAIDKTNEYIKLKNEFYQLIEYSLSNLFAHFRALIDMDDCSFKTTYPINKLFQIIRRDLLIYKIGLPLKQLFDVELKSNREKDTCSFCILFNKIIKSGLKVKFNYEINHNTIQTPKDINLIVDHLNLIDIKKNILLEILIQKHNEIQILINNKTQRFFNKWIKHSTLIDEEKLQLSLKIDDLIYIFLEIMTFSFSIFICFFVGSKIYIKNDDLAHKLTYIQKNNNKNVFMVFWDAFINEWGEIKSISLFSEMVKRGK